MKPMNASEARAAWLADAPMFAQMGIHAQGVQSYVPREFAQNFDLAMDAQPALVTTSNAGIPAFLTTLIDPEVFEIYTAPNKGAEILGEVRKGSWLDETVMFPTVERTGETTSYGDNNEGGRAGANTMWPQRQSYLFQTIKEYGEREMERAGLGKINWAAEIDKAAAIVLGKFLNLTYFFGVANLANYGMTNDPGLPASLTPAIKAAGGGQWIKNGQINAQANEVYADIQALFLQLVLQTQGLVEQSDELLLNMSPASEVALTATNTYNVNVSDLLKKNFPNLKVKTAVQFGAATASNPQGLAAGSMVQMVAPKIEAQESGYCAYNEKMRNHTVVKQLSSFRQKVTSGTWGAIVRQPFAFASMVGV